MSVTAPGAFPASALQTSFSAEPQTIHPEFLPDASCLVRPGFGARIRLIVGGPDEVILLGVRFGFNDRFGGHTLPTVIPIPGFGSAGVPSSAIPTSSPIPIPGAAALPGASSIPIPGSPPLHGLFISSGTSRELPFYLKFGCGFGADGTLIISVDTADRRGRSGTSELRVRIAP